MVPCARQASAVQLIESRMSQQESVPGRVSVAAGRGPISANGMPCAPRASLLTVTQRPGEPGRCVSWALSKSRTWYSTTFSYRHLAAAWVGSLMSMRRRRTGAGQLKQVRTKIPSAVPCRAILPRTVVLSNRLTLTARKHCRSACMKGVTCGGVSLTAYHARLT